MKTKRTFTNVETNDNVHLSVAHVTPTIVTAKGEFKGVPEISIMLEDLTTDEGKWMQTTLTEKQLSHFLRVLLDYLNTMPISI